MQVKPLEELKYESFWRISHEELSNILTSFNRQPETYDWTNWSSVSMMHTCLLQELQNADDICMLVVEALDHFYTHVNKIDEKNLQRLSGDFQFEYILKKMTSRKHIKQIFDSLLPSEVCFIQILLKNLIHSPSIEEYVVKIAEDIVVYLKYSKIQEEKLDMFKELFVAFDEDVRRTYLKRHMKPNLYSDLVKYYLTHVDYFGYFTEQKYLLEVRAIKNILQRIEQEKEKKKNEKKKQAQSAKKMKK